MGIHSPAISCSTCGSSSISFSLPGLCKVYALVSIHAVREATSLAYWKNWALEFRLGDTPMAKADGFLTYVSNVGLCQRLYSAQGVGDT